MTLDKPRRRGLAKFPGGKKFIQPGTNLVNLEQMRNPNTVHHRQLRFQKTRTDLPCKRFDSLGFWLGPGGRNENNRLGSLIRDAQHDIVIPLLCAPKNAYPATHCPTLS